MAIVVDSTTATSGAVGLTYTFSHTCSGSDRLLVVTVGHSTSESITGVTYNGVAMTLAGSSPTTPANTRSQMWYLLAPSTGANNVVITGTNAGFTKAGGAMSFTGVAQSGQPDTTSTGGYTTTTSYAQSVTTVSDRCFTVLSGLATSGSTLTAGSGTSIGSQPDLLFGTFFTYSTSAKTPAGLVTLTQTSSSQGFVGMMASFSPAVYTLSASAGAFTLTGVAVTLTVLHNYAISLASGVFTMTMSGLYAFKTHLFNNLPKHPLGSPTNASKSAVGTPTNQSKSIMTPTNIPKS